jgi:SAM-dependent methyltransferase
MKVRWQNQYDKKSPPWDYDKFDPDFQKFFKDQDCSNKITENCKIIDLGCGTGSQVYHIKSLGFDVIGTDILNVLEYDINFIIDDALDSKLSSKYEIIIDRGLIHNLFHLENKDNYFRMMNDITHDESYIVLKTMSPYEPRFHPAINSQTGPYRFNEGQLIELFEVIDFECIEIKDTFFHSNSVIPHLRGYFCIYTKRRKDHH